MQDKCQTCEFLINSNKQITFENEELRIELEDLKKHLITQLNEPMEIPENKQSKRFRSEETKIKKSKPSE